MAPTKNRNTRKVTFQTPRAPFASATAPTRAPPPTTTTASRSSKPPLTTTIERCDTSSEAEKEEEEEKESKLKEEERQKRAKKKAKKKKDEPEDELKKLLYFDVHGYGLHSDIHYKEPCQLEKKCFNFERWPSLLEPYIYFRNRILQLWVKNSCRQVTFFDVMHHIPEAKYKSKRRFMKVVYDFLEQNCFINFGVFTISKPRRWIGDRRRVIVIGAGVAGLAAARQLTYFDFDVIVLEAQPRFGGRCYTMVKDLGPNEPPAVVNMGATFVSSAYNNPFLTLMKQLKIDPMGLTGKGKIFCDGECLSAELEERLEMVYLKMLALMMFMWGTLGTKWYSPGGEIARPVSVDHALAFIYALFETSVMAESTQKCEENYRVLDTLNMYVDLMSANYSRFTSTFQSMYTPHLEHRDVDERGFDQGDLLLNYDLQKLRAFLRGEGEDGKKNENPFSKLYDAHYSFQKCQEYEDRFWDAYPDYVSKSKEPAIRVSAFMSTEHRRILEWHKGVLEILLGCRLADLHAEAFVKDNALDQTRSPFYLEYGYNELLDRLVRGAGHGQRPLSITLNAMVKEVELQPEGVLVRTIVNGKPIVVNGHACLITVPLGVLKKAVEEEKPLSEQELARSPSPPPSPESPPPTLPPPKKSSKKSKKSKKAAAEEMPPPPRPRPPPPENKINFVPPLPPKKVSAIRRLGFGLTNKVVIGFDEKFWDREGGFFENEDFLGFVPITTRGRAEFTLFYLHDTLPIITAMIGGQAALDGEEEDVGEDLLFTRALNTLREIFVSRDISMPYPAWYSTSSWGSNTFFRGSHTYTSVDASTEDYDTLAEPVVLTPGSKPEGVARLFFAGEHCSRKHQGTTHGAYESGLKAAARIGWTFLPCW